MEFLCVFFFHKQNARRMAKLSLMYFVFFSPRCSSQKQEFKCRPEHQAAFKCFSGKNSNGFWQNQMVFKSKQHDGQGQTVNSQNCPFKCQLSRKQVQKWRIWMVAERRRSRRLATPKNNSSLSQCHPAEPLCSTRSSFSSKLEQEGHEKQQGGHLMV